jgi:hypothetical protein
VALSLFQAVLGDGSSFITGDVGDVTGPAEQNGNLPCYDVGGIAGS